MIKIRIILAAAFLVTFAAGGAAALHQRVDVGIVERPDQHLHWTRHQGVGVGTEFPVAQVGGGEQDPAPGFDRLREVLETLVANPLRHVAPADPWQPGEGHQQPSDRPEHAVHHPLPAGLVQFS